MDKDSSGAASLDEFKSVGQSLPGGTIDQSDDALSSAFSSLDSDSDGSLTESEIATGLAKFSQESASALLGQQEAGGPPPGGGKDLITEADSDDSGTVSLAEFTAAGPTSASSDQAESLFSSIDADGDGEITATEDETFRSSQQAGHAGPPPGALASGDASASSSDDDDDDTTTQALVAGPPPGGPPPGAPPSSDASASTDDDDDDDDTTTTSLSAQLSELLSARASYSASSVSSYLNSAASSLFSASA